MRTVPKKSLALLLLAGDRTGYERACGQMVERCGKPGGPRAYHAARACTLAPDAIVEATAMEGDPGLALTGLLLTMHDTRTRVSGDVVAEVRRHFPDAVFATVVPRNVRITEARLRQGIVSRFDVLTAQTALSTAQQQLIATLAII